jgi:alkylation response protein AidB-like acyl-CoA dehydrogenase
MAERCAHAVDLCYHAGGGTSVYETSPLQRVFRDTHVATQHGMIAPRTLEPLGRMVFGLPTDTRQL